MEMKTKSLSLMQKMTTETCRGARLELEYYLLREREPERYGVKIRACQQGVWTCEEVPDLTSSQEEARRVLAMLARGTVTPESLRDVVDDWL